MMLLAVLYFQYITIVFKPFGESLGHHDQFLTYASTIGMIFNILSRLVGGIVLDRVSFKLYLGYIITLSTLLSLTYPSIA